MFALFLLYIDTQLDIYSHFRIMSITDLSVAVLFTLIVVHFLVCEIYMHIKCHNFCCKFSENCTYNRSKLALIAINCVNLYDYNIEQCLFLWLHSIRLICEESYEKGPWIVQSCLLSKILVMSLCKIAKNYSVNWKKAIIGLNILNMSDLYLYKGSLHVPLMQRKTIIFHIHVCIFVCKENQAKSRTCQ